MPLSWFSPHGLCIPTLPFSFTIFPISSCLFLSASQRLVCLRALPSSLRISLSTPLPLRASLLSLLPGEWQAHKCSNDSGRGVSVTAIEAVTGAEPGLGANAASPSTAEPLWLRQTGRDGATDRPREADSIHSPPIIHQHDSFLQPNNHHDPVTLPTVCQRLSTLDTEGPQQMDGRDWLAQGFAVT